MTTTGAPAVTAGSRVRLFPLAMREEQGSWIVGRPDTGSFINVPPLAHRALTLLGEGRTVGEVADGLRAESGEDVDVDGFVTALVDLAYVSEIDGRALAVTPPAPQTFAWLRPAHVRWLLHPATAWAAAVIVAASVIAAASRPELLPAYRDLPWSGSGAAVIAGNAAIAWTVIFLHELAHLATARAAGVPGRMSLGTRLQFLVAQTDVSGVWAAPRRTRMIVYLSGTAVDLVIAAGCLLARLTTPAGSPPDQLLAALTLFTVSAIPLQLLIFMRTDAYFVVQDFFGCTNLYADGPSWFVFMIGGWLGHTRWNILRCLAGVEASTGPDLALSHESVRNGVRGLPDLFGRLPELEALLV